MIKRYTPRCMRNKYIESSKTLNHYQSYGIFEILRLPAYVPESVLYELMIDDENVRQIEKEQTPTLLVTVGQFKSLLIHLQYQHSHHHATSDINSPEKRHLRQKGYHQFCVEDHFYHT